jgi:hypothetical protein
MRALTTTLFACALIASAILVPATSNAQGGSPKVLVSTTGNDSELRSTIPITRKAGQKPRVALSLGPSQVPSLNNGDRLKTTSELQVTTDCYEKDSGCVGKPYSFNPIVSARVVLANAPKVTGGEGALELGSERLKCRQKPPDREHHCVIVFDAVLEIPDKGQLPCTAANCHLNVSVEAHNPKKESGKRSKLLIGENEPDGSIGQDKGRLNAIRFSPADQPPVKPRITNSLLTTSVPIRKGDDVVVFSQELDGLKANDQIVANAGMTTSVEALPYAVLIRSRLVLTKEPTKPNAGNDVREITNPNGELSEANGFNCTQRNPICNTNKVGVITMTADAEDEDGDPIPLYANLVLNTAKPGAVAPSSDKVEVLPAGGIQVNVYPASLRG